MRDAAVKRDDAENVLTAARFGPVGTPDCAVRLIRDALQRADNKEISPEVLRAAIDAIAEQDGVTRPYLVRLDPTEAGAVISAASAEAAAAATAACNGKMLACSSADCDATSFAYVHDILDAKLRHGHLDFPLVDTFGLMVTATRQRRQTNPHPYLRLVR